MDFRNVDISKMPPIRFALINSNMLTSLGLQQLLRNLLPIGEIVMFNSFEDLKKDVTSLFMHYFVSSNIYFDHIQYFRERIRKTIVLVEGDMQIAGVHTLNVCQNERVLIKEIMELKNQGHHHASVSEKPDDDKELLSQREREVAALLCKGLINKEVAEYLGVSPATVITHRRNIMEKIRAKSLADIIIYCVANGIINIDEQ